MRLTKQPNRFVLSIVWSGHEEQNFNMVNLLLIAKGMSLERIMESITDETV